jgi:hypothetical protein
VGDIVAHLLEKVWSILMARSSENGVMNCGLSGWTELAGRGRESFFGLLGMRMRERMLESWCVVEGVCRGPFIV